MGPEQQGPAPSIPAAGAVPKPAPPEQLNLEAGKQQANQEMADADVSEKQLAESNEPDFQQALADKKEAAAHADTAPGEFRKQEQDVITQAKTEAAAETKAGVTGMQGAKGAALAKLVADKGKTKSKDEAKRAEVTAKVQSIYAETEKDVKKILDGIDPKVEKEFETGEKDARAVFESYVSAKMSAYKKDRYSGWLGGYRWLRDKLVGMPVKVNEFYEAGRELYLKQMDGVITRVANIVGDDLTAAKKRIAAGKTEIASYVKSLPAGLKKVGAEASKEIADKFEQLEDDVNAKQDVRRRHPGFEVCRSPQGPRRAHRGTAGREQGPGRQGDRRDQGHHQHDSPARRDADERAGPGGRCGRRHHQGAGPLPGQPDRRREGRHPQVQGQHPRPFAQGPDELAVRRAGRRRSRAARQVRPAGHHQAARVAVRADVAKHP